MPTFLRLKSAFKRAVFPGQVMSWTNNQYWATEAQFNFWWFYFASSLQIRGSTLELTSVSETTTIISLPIMRFWWLFILFLNIFFKFSCHVDIPPRICANKSCSTNQFVCMSGCVCVCVCNCAWAPLHACFSLCFFVCLCVCVLCVCLCVFVQPEICDRLKIWPWSVYAMPQLSETCTHPAAFRGNKKLP